MTHETVLGVWKELQCKVNSIWGWRGGGGGQYGVNDAK